MRSMEDLKMVLREEQIPYFTDQELQFYLSENDGDYNKTAYQCLLIKAENTTLTISGLTTADTSTYFRRLAGRYRPRNSGILSGRY